MGEAEDIVFGRESARSTAAAQTAAQSATRMLDEMRSGLVATAIKSLRATNYPSYISRSGDYGSRIIGIEREVIHLNGEERVAWVVARNNNRADSPSVYFLADGTFITPDFNIQTHVHYLRVMSDEEVSRRSDVEVVIESLRTIGRLH